MNIYYLEAQEKSNLINYLLIRYGGKRKRKSKKLHRISILTTK